MSDITLRPIAHSDLEQIRVWRNSPEVSKYMYTENQITADAQENWFKSLQQDASKKYWIIEYEGQDLGVANLYSINQQFKNCYWAFYLGNSSIRGAGIGSKVEFNVLSYVFDELNFNKLLCEVFVSNDSVIKMHEKFGFRRESYFREHILKHDQFLDVVGLAMLNRDWKIVKEAHYKKIYEAK